MRRSPGDESAVPKLKGEQQFDLPHEVPFLGVVKIQD
jgi:hypothetical protein